MGLDALEPLLLALPITITGGGKCNSNSIACVNWVNTVLGNLKTATAETYHAFDFHKYAYDHLHRETNRKLA